MIEQMNRYVEWLLSLGPERVLDLAFFHSLRGRRVNHVIVDEIQDFDPDNLTSVHSILPSAAQVRDGTAAAVRAADHSMPRPALGDSMSVIFEAVDDDSLFL